MFYSFEVRADTKEAALQSLIAKFDELFDAESEHRQDRAMVIDNADSAINSLDDDSDHDVVVVVRKPLDGGHLSATASLAPRKS